MNSLLKLEFFKSLGFASKENGMEFIKCTPKLQKEIQVKVDFNIEQTHFLLEDIKENVFSKFDNKKDLFIIKTKNERGDKLSNKKDLLKLALKEEMRNDILLEIQNEQEEAEKEKLKIKYPKCIPKVSDEVNFINLNKLFIEVLVKMDNGLISIDEMKNIEKAKEQVEKAIAVLIKAKSTLEYLNEE